MIEIISNAKTVAKYQKRLVKELKAFCEEKIVCTLGYQGGSQEFEVFYSKKFDFWFTAQDGHNRYWNAFGLGRPKTEKNNSITVEINIPYEGISRNISGVFGLDKTGEILVLHRGKIGGGRIGIGKSLFFSKNRGDTVAGDDGGTENSFCLIGSLGSKILAQQVAFFISEVYRIKNLAFDDDESASVKAIDNFEFTEESTGDREIKHSGSVIIERTHGIVVNQLAKLLEAKGYKVSNDRNRDLFIHNRGKITKLFEIKRSSSNSDLYSAVGQLLIYSIPINTPAALILVVPDKLKSLVEKKLREFGITILYYDWNNGDPTFENLNKII